MMSLWQALVGIGAGIGLLACSHPPPRLAVELTARANAKASIVPLVVSDPVRAQRLRAIYKEVTRLGYEFDHARSHARAECRAAAERLGPDPIASGALECLIAPPLGEKDRAALAAYTRLMAEARSLLTQREFDKLARMR
jgi:hypothetical protein